MRKLRISKMPVQNRHYDVSSSKAERSRRIGYARVSTDDQHLDLQINALNEANCDHIFTDQGISGKVSNRPGLKKVMASLKNGDTLIVWRLDRLGRSLVNLVEIINNLGKRGVEFQSLTENIDTSSSGGRLVFHILAALTEFERALISERTRAGMEAARLKGKQLGRPPKVKANERREIKNAFQMRKASVAEIAQKYNLSARAVRAIIKSTSTTLAD